MHFPEFLLLSLTKTYFRKTLFDKFENPAKCSFTPPPHTHTKKVTSNIYEIVSFECWHVTVALSSIGVGEWEGATRVPPLGSYLSKSGTYPGN